MENMTTKALQFIICLLLLGHTAFAQDFEELEFGTNSTFEVATWNIEWFPKNGQTTVDYVVDIIEALDIDVLAIQEVDDVGEFEQMMEALDDYEGYLESTWFAGLAYIYKSDVIQINELYEIYTTSPYWSPFPRSPMVMDLNYGDERIIVINNHFKCCGDGTLELSDTDDEETRRFTASSLLKEYIDLNFPNENVIMLGDLNDNLTDSPENNVFQPFFDEDDNLFVDYEIALSADSAWSYPTWPSHLDHIMISNELFDEFENDSSCIETISIDEYFPGGWWTYENNVSDHRPVALKLKLDTELGLESPSSQASMFRNSPNPFSSTTRFSFPPSSEVQYIEIINLQGQTVFSEEIAVGESMFTLHAQELLNGCYVAKLISANSITASSKLLLIK